MSEVIKHESTSQPGLFFWAEDTDPEGILTGPKCYMVVSQVDGYPSTEAWDDWFCKQADADQMAQRLAKGEL